MYEDGCSAAVDYYSKIMTKDDVLILKCLVSRFQRAPNNCREYLQNQCRDVQGLVEFFQDNSHLFHVENGRVALADDNLEKSRERAVTFFEKKLKTHGRALPYMELKVNYLENAPEDVISYITSFYPGKEFKRFLKSSPDVFVLYDNHTVFLIEVESVEFYKNQLKSSEEKRMPFMNFRGKIGQAKPHVQKYMNRYFLGDDFQVFLKRNNHVFILDKDMKVSLVPFV